MSFTKVLDFEFSIRQLLGQPLSVGNWDKMTFNDKIDYRRLREMDPLVQEFSDKLAMRDYVTDRLGEESLPKLLEVGDHASLFAQRQGPFVLKANHGSGMVTFVGEGEFLSQSQLDAAESWLTVDYCWDELEWGYAEARRLLLVEEFLQSSHRKGIEPPPDYKFFTFDGGAEMIQVDIGRFSDHRRMLRRPDWSPLAGSLGSFEPPEDFDLIRPANLEIMCHMASQLGRGIAFVRVDLYDLGSRVLVGELTPYPGGGNERYVPKDMDNWLGKFWAAQSS
jgi:hypothetical protein